VSRGQLRTAMKTCSFVMFYEYLPHIGLHHTSHLNSDPSNQWAF
jgi:hypothetical protein